MTNIDTDNKQSTGKLDTGNAIVTDGGGVAGNQATQQDSSSMLSEAWEKLAVGSGSIAIIAVLFLPVLSLNVPEGMSQMLESVGGSGLTLGDARDLVSSFAQLSAIGGGGSTSQQLSTASTVLNVAFYAIIGGGGLLIAGAAKKRAVAIAGAVVQTLPVLGLTYAVFVLIPDVIKEQLGSGLLGASVGEAASQLVAPGLGLYLLIAASLGGIISVVMAYR
jgi:hypothetical protein